MTAIGLVVVIVSFAVICFLEAAGSERYWAHIAATYALLGGAIAALAGFFMFIWQVMP